MHNLVATMPTDAAARNRKAINLLRLEIERVEREINFLSDELTQLRNAAAPKVVRISELESLALSLQESIDALIRS